MMCGTSFHFDKEDIRKGERFPFVVCPQCSHEMKLGWNKDYFKRVERRVHKKETTPRQENLDKALMLGRSKEDFVNRHCDIVKAVERFAKRLASYALVRGGK